MISAKILLYLLMVMEGGPDENKLNLSRAFVEDVQVELGPRHSYEDVCASTALSGAYAWRYLKRYNALHSYEKAIRVFNGGPRGHLKKGTLAKWLDIKVELERVRSMKGRIP